MGGKRGQSRTSLACPPRLADYPAGSWVVSVCFFALMLWGWVAAWTAQICFTYTVGLMIKSKTRLEAWNGFLFRLFSAKLTFLLTPFVSMKVKGWKPTKDMVAARKGVMVVANHRSFMDPFALGAAMFPLECKYVAKADLFAVPFGGWAMGRAGDLKVKFDKHKNAGWGTVKGSTGQLLALAATQLQAGNSVAMFPEGTRMGFDDQKSRDAENCVMPFKPPFFDLAKKLDVPVVCVAIKGTDDVWPVGSNMLRPATITVDVAEPLDPNNFDTDEAFADAARKLLGDMYLRLCREDGAVGKTKET